MGDIDKQVREIEIEESDEEENEDENGETEYKVKKKGITETVYVPEKLRGLVDAYLKTHPDASKTEAVAYALAVKYGFYQDVDVVKVKKKKSSSKKSSGKIEEAVANIAEEGFRQALEKALSDEKGGSVADAKIELLMREIQDLRKEIEKINRREDEERYNELRLELHEKINQLAEEIKHSFGGRLSGLERELSEKERERILGLIEEVLESNVPDRIITLFERVVEARRIRDYRSLLNDIIREIERVEDPSKLDRAISYVERILSVLAGARSRSTTQFLPEDVEFEEG